LNKKELIEEVKKIVNPVYQVGGSVRDEILGLEPKDYDFATKLSPEEIEQAVRNVGRRPYLTGKRFGTIGVKIEGQLVEITSFRAEKYTVGSRKPIVQYVNDIIADLNRRDFTINAIAKRDNRYIDPWDGREDIDNKIIRCVGSPNTRFKEDPLRLLRAARFMAQLGFDIESKTQKSAIQKNYKILEVSKERWVMELDKLLLSDKPSIGLNFLMETGIMKFILPEIAIQYKLDQDTPYHDFDLWTHTSKVVDATPKDIILRWAALLHDIGKPFVRYRKENPDRYVYHQHDLLGADMVNKLARHLKFSNERRECLVTIVKDHVQDDSPLREYDSGAQKKKEA